MASIEMNRARATAMASVLATFACSADLRGTITIEPDEEQNAVRFTFAPASGQVDPGHLFLEINVDGAELLFSESRGSQACVGVPANGVVMAGVPPDQDLDCVTIAAVVYQWAEPETEKDSAGNVTVEEAGPRCGGDHVIDSTSWREIAGCPRDAGPVVRDAGSTVRDGGSFVRDGGVTPRDGGDEAPDAGSVDAGDSADPDAGEDETDGGE